MTTLHEVALLRLAAQRIAGPGMASPAEVVRWLTAMQAQDYPGVLTSVALRTTAGTRQGVEHALDAAEVVRSWPMRGTLHLVAAEDLAWMLKLTATRVVAGAARRRTQLDLDSPILERARALTVETLTVARQSRRRDLFAVWDAAGLVTTGQRGYHMLWHLAQTGTVCLGPVHDGEQLIVLVDEWIPRSRVLERDESLGELAWRYFAGHGPATIKDFTRWTWLVAADARAGLAIARPRLTKIDVEGVEHFLDPQTPDLLDTVHAQAQDVFLLPGFDEFILGYQDRRAVLPAEFADRIVPGGNGVFRPTVVHEGRVVATWTQSGRGPKRTVAATPFTAFPDNVVEAIATAYARLP